MLCVSGLLCPAEVAVERRGVSWFGGGRATPRALIGPHAQRTTRRKSETSYIRSVHPIQFYEKIKIYEILRNFENFQKFGIFMAEILSNSDRARGIFGYNYLTLSSSQNFNLQDKAASLQRKPRKLLNSI